MKDEQITIREKGQYETNTEYLEWIKQQIEKHNNIIIQKNSEISDLKSKLSKLEAEKAKMEKAQSDSVITKTEIDLRAIIDDLNKVLAENKNKKDDSRIDELISKVDRSLVEYADLSQELKEVRAELSKPVNLGSIQEYIKRQDELEDLIKDIYDNVKSGKDEIIENINNVKEEEKYVPSFNNMEQAVNLVSENTIQPDADIPSAKSIVDQMSNYESQLNNDVDKDQNQSVASDQNNQQENINPFDQALNPVQDTATIEQTNENIEPTAVPFVNNSETIAPDASVLSSIVPQEVPVQQNEDNNIIEETTPTDVVQNSEVNEPVQNPMPVDENVQPNVDAPSQIPEGAEKVENVEEASQELTEQAKQSMVLNASAIKARRGFVNKTKESERIADIFHIDSWLLNNVELSDDIKDYFNSSIPSEIQEQSNGRLR